MRHFKLKLVLVAGLTASGVPAAGQDVARGGDANPQSLEDLIPEDAVDNAQDWATRGVSPKDPPDSPGEPEPAIPDDIMAFDEAMEELVADNAEAAAGPAEPFDLDTALERGSVEQPEPLAPDPDRPSFADIAAPSLIELPELEATRLSDELVLAFPLDQARFPEEAEFVARFAALSAIEALESEEDTIPQLAARARSDEELLIQILRTYGYYDGQVVRQLSGGRRGFSDQSEEGTQRRAASDPQVRFDVLPGTRFSFGTIDLGALDTVPEDDLEALRDAFGISPGDPLYADRIVSQSSALATALGESGYPFAELGEPSLLIDHARQEGDLTLEVKPGGKFVFGSIRSSDPDFLSGRHLESIARFEKGDTYSASLQADLRRAILATGLVSSVAITPREETPRGAGDDEGLGEVALDVAMERAPLRTISGAIGYGTEDGFKVEAGWEHRNLFPPEGSLRLRGIVGTREQLASVTFTRRNFRERDQTFGVDAYASAIETEAVDARTVGLRAGFERVSNLIFQKPFGWQAGVEVLFTDERNRTIGGFDRPRQTFLIGGLFGSVIFDRSDDLLDPTSGFRLSATLAPEVSRSQGTDSYYLRAQADASVYEDVGQAVLAGRIRAATIQGAEPFEIAPSRRLYAGGGGSVRGYGFQGIGPRNDLGEATGGGSLVEVAVEARIQTGFLDGAVEVVPFFDAGSVSIGSTPDFRFIQYGAGLGVRYKTSFGPIRVDLGVPLNPTEFDAPVVLYVSLGQAF